MLEFVLVGLIAVVATDPVVSSDPVVAADVPDVVDMDADVVPEPDVVVDVVVSDGDALVVSVADVSVAVSVLQKKKKH